MSRSGQGVSGRDHSWAGRGVCECVGWWTKVPACLHTYFSQLTSTSYDCGETSRARSLASLRTWEEEHAEFNPREKRSDTMGFGITSEKILSCRLVVLTFLTYLSVISRECMRKKKEEMTRSFFSSDDYTEGGGKVAKLINLQ